LQPHQPHQHSNCCAKTQLSYDVKKSLKIPKGQSESVYRKRDNTMAKRKKYKRTNNDRQTYI